VLREHSAAILCRGTCDKTAGDLAGLLLTDAGDEKVHRAFKKTNFMEPEPRAPAFVVGAGNANT
jgi:hypothetical protein